MHTGDSNKQDSKWKQIQAELSVSEMLAMYDYAETGVDCEIIIGDENEHLRVLRNPDIPKGAFTAVGKLTQTGFDKILKAAKKKYKTKVLILCMR